MVDNALRYGDGEIRLWARPADGMVELHVSDAGRGFPDGLHRPRLRALQPRRRGAGPSGGTGLGLAIVETIARAHGGTAMRATRPAAAPTSGSRSRGRIASGRGRLGPPPYPCGPL